MNTGSIPNSTGFHNTRDNKGKFTKAPRTKATKKQKLPDFIWNKLEYPSVEEITMRLTAIYASETYKKLTAKKPLKPYLKGDPNNVLIIGDTHAPFTREGYLEFCREQQERYNCGTVVHIGDEVDNCAMSFHEKDPDGDSAATEATKAQIEMNKWYALFPTVSVCIGNHTELAFRQAKASGVAKRFLKPYEEAWCAPKGWKWATEFEYNGVLYTHGTGTSGDKAAINKALNMRQSVVQGHIHTIASINYNVSPKDILFGMQVGCGIDDKAYAFNYAKSNIKKSIISCGVVINGTQPILIPMPI